MRRLTGLLAIVAIATAAWSLPAGAVAGFNDVAASDYWAKPVQWMVNNGITTGTGEGCFSPRDPVTRGQAAAFMWRMEGEPTPSQPHTFVDVSATWQMDAVSWMLEEGITTGTSPTRYSPNDSLTRGQLAALLHRLAGNPSASGHPFLDISAPWQQTPVAWMTAEQITTGVSAFSFAPDEIVSRGQLATFFHRYKGSPPVVLSMDSPACTGRPVTSVPTTPTVPDTPDPTDPDAPLTPGMPGTPGQPSPPVDCTATTADPFADVWYDMHYNAGTPSCERPDFEASGATRIVDRSHPNASDDNAGTAAAPWRTIVHAATTAASGEIVDVKAGTYNDGPIEARTSDVIFSAYPGDEREVIIEGSGFRAWLTSNLIVHGFAFRDLDNNGILVVGPDVRNVVIANNDTYNTDRAGVALRGVLPSQDAGDFDGVQDVLIIGNRIRRAALVTSEVLSIGSGVVNLEIVGNELADGGPVSDGGDEGIALKEGVRDTRIYGNVVHHLADRGIHIDGGSGDWDSLITNIEVFDNLIYENKNQGLWVTTEGMGDVDGVHIHDNIAWGNRTFGFLVYEHPHGQEAGGTVKNIVIEHNIAFDNGEHGGHDGFRVAHPTATGIVVRNNIAWGNTGHGTRGEAETVFAGNLCEDDDCAVRADPQFLDAPADFTLAAGSPARGAATDGSDIGPR